MDLSVKHTLRPFSHLPGTSTPLPGSTYLIRIYPCLIEVYSIAESSPQFIQSFHLDLKGPVEQFTVWNDLEKSRITVGGKTSDGWIRYHLSAHSSNSGILFICDRVPGLSLTMYSESKPRTIHRNEGFDLFTYENSSLICLKQCQEQLSFGNYKAQDIELIRRRLNIQEIFPLWYRMGQLFSLQTSQYKAEGNLLLLEDCKKSLLENHPEKDNRLWLNLFQAGFTSLFSPQLVDSNHLGLISSSEIQYQQISPLTLLVEGARVIREMFLSQRNNQLFVLPHLLPELHCGTFLNVEISQIGTMSIEWTKKTIRRCVFYSKHNQEIEFIFKSNVQSYRLRDSSKQMNLKCNRASLLTLQENTHYFFDNFMG